MLYVRAANPDLTEQWEQDLYIVALTEASLSDAWRYQRSFPEESESRKQLIQKVIETCLLRESYLLPTVVTLVPTIHSETLP